eukprot:CAMPEP_0113607280 /NCGR_PEP_ID=MMETSP0017_2-20120614/3301_1 /TAXON_ID=2856 /ORGANISM="Cylindrotheca closterium" /LENGTH=216 /DNA_ID=CAMNT_0000515875 /DNA_START=29 /DNA_END=679 /DNA_ORIENTATION=+ /assembly_acc=CAM_ASM_000147
MKLLYSSSITSFVYCLVLLQAATNIFHDGVVVNAFPSPGLVRLSNATKSRLMSPLSIDQKLGLVPNGASSEDETPPSPRGIVLNTCVGGLTFCGGLMGYVTKGSKASLIAGSTFGGLLSLSAFLISKKQKAGNIMGTIVGSMLSYVMGKKFLASKKFMPAGLIASLGIATVVYNAIEAFGGKTVAVNGEIGAAAPAQQQEAAKDDPVEKPTSTEEE